LPGTADATQWTEGSVTQLPVFLRGPFAAAMSQAMLLPAFVALFGVVAALLMLGFANSSDDQAGAAGAALADGGIDQDRGETEFDDDPYVEYVVHWDDA
ncbi:MAG: MFS transporter, partial [Mycobacterium sp.]